MKVIKHGRWLLAIVLSLVGSVGFADNSNTPSGFTASGIGAPSWPFFLDTNETINVTRHGSGANTYWTLTGTGSTTSFWDGLTNHVNLRNDSVYYQANFNSAGQLITSIPSNGSTQLTNYLEINGSLPAGQFGGTSWTAQPNELLLKANLLGSGSNNNTPATFANIALGFKTEFTGGWAANNLGLTGGSSGENLWLVGLSSGFQKLVKALDGNPNNGTLSNFGATKTITGVVSIASVPLPGAVWLFGTGLMTLLAGRRKSAAARLAA